jgi:glycosyltransferase involved in cell wall biosynthesis
MKLLVANNATPFVRGGAELLADRLVTELRRAGHEVDLLRFPLGSTPEEILDSTIAASLWNVRMVDRVIGLKFPAYLIPHDDMVIWLVHQLRQAYEPPPVGWPRDPSLDPVVDAVRAGDRRAFAQATAVHTISPEVAGRLQRDCGIRAPVLMTPPHTDLAYRCEPPEDFLLALGRVSHGKRQRAAIEAMRHARPGYRLVVAGAPESPSILDQIRSDIASWGIDDRVELIPRYIDDAEKLDLLARCAASVYLPLEEDSYGYVTYEAAMSAKPTVTGADSGGTHTLVADGTSGLVVDVEPHALAAGFDSLVADQDATRAMGVAARDAALALDLSWERVVRELTS